MKNIKRIMIILAIMIIFLIIMLVFILTSKGKVKNEILDPEYEEGDIVILNKTLKTLNIKNDYFILKNIISLYFDSINAMYEDNSEYFTEDEIKENIQYYQKAIYNMLDKNYIKEFKISENQIYNMYKKIGKSKHLLNDIKYYDISDSLKLYLIEGENVEYENNNKTEVKLMIIIDYINNTYSIFPWEYVEKHKIDKYKIGDSVLLNFSIEKIEKNDNNTFIYKNITKEEVAVDYFNTYKFKMLYDVKSAYYNLDEEYRNKRFGNVEEFTNYIKSRFKEIYISNIDSYMINKYDEYTEYVVKDQYDNLYIFKETSVGKFTVILDTYTLEYEKFNNEYKNATNKEKVIMNIDKFFQMLNAKDYKTSYNLLDSNFRNMNFKTENTFKSYMESKLYSYNDVSYVNFSDEISGVYTYYIEISNRQNKNDKKIKMNIIMQLLEGTKYKLSFEILE